MDTESGRNGSDGNVVGLLNISSGGGKKARYSPTVVADSDSGGELPVLDRKLLESGSGGGQTVVNSRKMLRMVAVDAPQSDRPGRAEPDTPGVQYMNYWLWRCRNDQMDGSLHPLRHYNPLDLNNDNMTLIPE